MLSRYLVTSLNPKKMNLNKLKSLLLGIPVTIVLNGITTLPAQSNLNDLIRQSYIGKFPRGTDCIKDARYTWSTLNSSTGGRKHKIGVAVSHSCKTIWAVAEAPIDSIIVLENGDGFVLLGSSGRIVSDGYQTSKMVAAPLVVRACVTLPFAGKFCSEDRFPFPFGQ